MDNQEGLDYIRTYFDELFGKRNIDILDEYLDREYSDDDIPAGVVDHIKNSKEYLADWFRDRPTIGVDVLDAMAREDVITAFLEWFVVENQIKKVILKGIAIFVLRDRKILKRHTYLYFEE